MAKKKPSVGNDAAPGVGRSGPIVLAALLVPSVVFAVLLAALAAWDSGRRQEDVALARAREIVDRAEAAVSHEFRGLKAVSQMISGVPIQAPRPPPERLRLNAELFPQWVGSIIWAPDEPTALFSSLPWDALPIVPPFWHQTVSGRDGTIVDGVGFIEGRPMVFLHHRIPNDPQARVLTTGLDPDVFQDILMREVPDKTIAALVDRQGNFIARSLDAEARVGTPATTFVREAVASKRSEGVYRGRTYEGFENVTAFVVSPLTGWSAHIAFSSSEIAEATNLAITIGAVGGAIALGLAAVLTWLVATDARRRQRTAHALAQAQRIEALGRLTAGISHDFNNLLTVIIGSLQRPVTAPGRERSIETALVAARRAADLTRSLLAYSRQQTLVAQVVDTNACVREAIEVIGRTLGEAYRVEHELDDGVGPIVVDPGQLVSAILNLAVNARDAMAGGGVITISTSRRAATPAGSSGAAAFVAISVTDNGPGMTSDVASRAFDPFFTTKDVGKGTGLGLAQVQGFAGQSGGFVELKTQPGKGTSIVLLFPETERQAQAAIAHTDPRITKTGRVLVVEDDDAVREFARQLLEGLGHTVVASVNGSDGEERLRAHRYDLLFADVGLPGAMSGIQLAALARKLDPSIAVVLTTGYAGDEISAAESDFKVLPKPYEPQDLADIVSASIAERPTTRSMRVLIVDDEPVIRMIADEVLSDAGFVTEQAGTRKEALARASTVNFDVAIVDVQLPDGSGVALAKELMQAHPRLGVVIASGAPIDSNEFDFLQKPFLAQDLLSVIERILSRGGAA